MKKILLIEDNPQMRENVLLLLSLEQFQAIGAENGKRGLELIQREHPDLVLCDVMMPDMDGYEVLQAIRANPATALLPFILLTAKGEKPDQRHGMNLGADDYLVKPVAKADLLAAISTRLERRQMVEQQLQQAHRESLPKFDSPAPFLSQGLTQREAEVLLWLAQGKTNPEIAIILNISLLTVKKHVLHIYEKIGLGSRQAASLWAMETLKLHETSAPKGPPRT